MKSTAPSEVDDDNATSALSQKTADVVDTVKSEVRKLGAVVEDRPSNPRTRSRKAD